MSPQAARGDDRLLTVSEAAQRLHVPDTTLYPLIRSGVLPATLVRQQYRIRTSDLERLAAGTHAAAN